MSTNNPAPLKEIVAPSQPAQRNLFYAAFVASFLLFLIAGVFRMLVGQLDWAWAFFPAVMYWITTLPFTLLATFLYRRTNLSSRFELPAVILVVGVGLFIQMLTF